MSFWSKLGKIALQAAPYVAAPFTGGASLMATPMTQQLGQKFAGANPSKFDKILGGISGAAGAASSLGAFNKLGGGKSSGGMDEGDKPIGGGNIMELLGGLLNKPSGQQPSLSNSVGLPAGMMNLTGDGGNLPSRPIGPTTLSNAPNPSAPPTALPNAPITPNASIPQPLPNAPKDFGPGVFGEYGEFGDFKTRNPDIAGAIAQGRAAAIGGNRFAQSRRGGSRNRGRRPQMQPMMAQ